MTRSDLIARLTLDDRGLTPDQIDQFVDRFFGLLQDRLRGDTVITVFGPVQHLQLQSTRTHSASRTGVDVEASLIPATPPPGSLLS